jgi:hypothetical protein
MSNGETSENQEWIRLRDEGWDEKEKTVCAFLDDFESNFAIIL